MARSFKHQPFSAITGSRSAKNDKVYAHRGVRRAQNAAIAKALKEDGFDEDFNLPHFRECHWNNVYNWSRDGKQHYQKLDNNDWQRYLKAQEPETYARYRWELTWYKKHYATWPPQWWQELWRK